MTHTPECLRQQSEMQSRRDKWIAQWPLYCRSCEGAGGFPVPGTHWEPPDYDLCNCLDHETCPRCGKVFPQDYQDSGYEEPCPHCGWNNGDGADDIAPPKFDYCGCPGEFDNPFNDNKQERNNPMTYPEWQKEFREAQEKVKKNSEEELRQAQAQREQENGKWSDVLSVYLVSVFGLPAGTPLGPNRVIDGYVFKAFPRHPLTGELTSGSRLWVEPLFSEEEMELVVDYDIYDHYSTDIMEDDDLVQRKADIANALDRADAWRKKANETIAEIKAKKNKPVAIAVIERELSDAEKIVELIRKIVRDSEEVLF